jgi:hypothetical protein
MKNKKKVTEKKIGEIHPPKTLFFRQSVGDAKDKETGLGYEMTVNMGQYTPIVKSEQTGKWFTLSWTDIINLAVEAGIDKP